MKTLELVTKLIEEKGICPVIKRKFIESKMSWILQNPETNKYVVISEKDVDELIESDIKKDEAIGSSAPKGYSSIPIEYSSIPIECEPKVSE